MLQNKSKESSKMLIHYKFFEYRPCNAEMIKEKQSRAKTRLGQTIHSMNKCLQCTALIASADTSPRQQSRAKTKLAESLQITYLVAFTMIGNHGSLPAKARSQMRAKQQKLQMWTLRNANRLLWTKAIAEPINKKQRSGTTEQINSARIESKAILKLATNFCRMKIKQRAWIMRWMLRTASI